MDAPEEEYSACGWRSPGRRRPGPCTAAPIAVASYAIVAGKLSTSALGAIEGIGIARVSAGMGLGVTAFVAPDVATSRRRGGAACTPAVSRPIEIASSVARRKVTHHSCRSGDASATVASCPSATLPSPLQAVPVGDRSRELLCGRCSHPCEPMIRHDFLRSRRARPVRRRARDDLSRARRGGPPSP